MYSRLVVPLVCAAAIVFACGPRPRGTVASKPVPVTGRPDGTRTAGVRHRHKGDTTRVDAELAIAPEADGVRLALSVVNVDSKQLEIDFPNGQTRDFVVLDATGREVWRWSRGRLFTQTVQNKFLSAGDTAVYEERWVAPTAGTYTAVATLRSRNYPIERRATFQVHPSMVAAVASVGSARR